MGYNSGFNEVNRRHIKMKLQPYIEKLENAPEYKDFKQKHPDSFLVAGFFIIDFETGKNLHQIDYYVPSEKKVAAFTLDDKIMMQMLNLMDDRIPEELDIRTNIDLDALNGIIEDEMKNRGLTEEIKKMIAVIQTVEGRKVWNVNCILSGMEILKTHVADNSEIVLKMEKSSVMDYIKKMPGPTELGAGQKKDITPEDIDREIEKLDKIKEALKKEKLEMEKDKVSPPDNPQPSG